MIPQSVYHLIFPSLSSDLRFLHHDGIQHWICCELVTSDSLKMLRTCLRLVLDRTVSAFLKVCECERAEVPRHHIQGIAPVPEMLSRRSSDIGKERPT